MDAMTPKKATPAPLPPGNKLVKIDPNTGRPAVTDWSVIDVEIKRSGKHLILPADPTEMEYDEGIKLLKRQKEMENQRYDVNEFVNGAPWDALVAINKAMKDIYGVV